MEIRKLQMIRKCVFFSLMIWGGLSFCSSAYAATAIYRSVGPANTADLNTSDWTMEISETTAFFSGSMPSNVGVGDVLQYDPGTGLTLAFISGRISSTVFAVQSGDGGTPEAAPAETAVEVFRSYTSLSEAENGTENSSIDAGLSDFDAWSDGKDLTITDQQWNIVCYGDAEDTTMGVVIQGWTTDADNYLRIYAPYLASEVGTSQRHSGVWDDNKYRLVVSDDFPEGPPLAINTGSDVSSVNVWIDGLQIFTNSMIMNSYGIEAYNVTGETKISNNIIKCDLALSSNWGLYVHNLTHTGTYKVWNNILYGFFDGGIYLSGSENTLYAHNNTIAGGSENDACYSQSSGTFVAKNNIAQSCAAGYAGDFGISSTNNLSDLEDAPGLDPANLSALNFANSGSGNYHLRSSDVAAIGQGSNLLADEGLSFSSDIGGRSRIEPWDIGAFRYIVGEIDETAPGYPSSLIVH
ncbi:MAG: hypothetical protein QG620_812 [Patescibacteria group bacterium]|nr:hypothetical protein [Patescibacteria group bacterium]